MFENEIYSNTFVIQQNNDCLKRSHIDNLIYNSIKKPLTTVVAVSGFGKTQSIYSFLQQYNCITMWQNMTIFDNSIDVYWKNTINNIAVNNKSFASKLENIGFYNIDKKFNMFLSLISNVMKPNKKYVIVYDDFHLIHTKKILRFLERLVNARILNLSIVLISRTEPDINMIGLNSKGLVSNICYKDLRFSKMEISNYILQQGFKISPSTLHNIYNITGGWLIGVRLMELSLKKGIVDEDYAIESMKTNIFKIIKREIFFDMPFEFKKFLVKLSLFKNLPIDILNEFGKNNNLILIEISKINLFMNFDSILNTYEIQNIFLDFLIEQQYILTKYEKYECYKIAAKLYESKGYKKDAIYCYYQTGDFESILEICLVFPYYLPKDIAEFFIDLLDKTPKEVYVNIPLLLIFRLRVLFSLLKTEEAQKELNIIIKEYENKPKLIENDIILGESYILMAMFKNITNLPISKYEFKNNFIKAYKYIPTGSIVMKDKNNIYDIGPYACRVSRHEKGYVEKYISAVTSSVIYASKLLYGYMCGYDCLTNAEFSYFKNNIREAERFSYQSLYKAREKGQYAIENMAILYLIRVNLSTGNYSKIQELIEQLDLNLTKTKNADAYTVYDIVTGWYYSVIGQTDKIANWIKSDFDKSNINFFLFGLESLVKIKYFLYQKEYHSILAFIEAQDSEYGVKGFLFGKIEMEAVRAVCFYHIKEKEEAIKSLQKAYELSQPNSLNMIFIELGNDMVSLAKVVSKMEDCKIPLDWLTDITKKACTYAKRRSHIMNKYRKANNLETNFKSKLTKKELAFLTDICQGLSRAEIASNYGISISFVKDKLQNIYFKLGAKNTKDAICISYLMDLVK